MYIDMIYNNYIPDIVVCNKWEERGVFANMHGSFQIAAEDVIVYFIS